VENEAGAGRSRSASDPVGVGLTTPSPARKGPPSDRHALLPKAVPLSLEGQAKEQLSTYAELFAPGLTRWEDPYRGRTYVEVEDEASQRRWRHCKAPLNLWRALAAHVAAGATSEAQPYREDGRALVTAIGLALHPSTTVRVLNVDLDGAYDPDAVVAALLCAVGPRFLVTSGSGRTGRYRVLLPIEPMPVRGVQTHGAALLSALGYPVKKGGAEVYPAITNGRLPFGAGGCLRFDATNLERSERAHPYGLLDRLLALPVVDLAAAARGGPAAPSRVLPRPRPTFEAAAPAAAKEPVMIVEEHEHAARAVLEALRPTAARPAPPPPALEAPRRSSLDPERTEAQIAALIAAPPPDPRQRPEKSTRYGRLWVQGVPDVGHRDDALYKLAKDSLYRRRNQRRAVVQIQRWIQGGGIERSRAVREGGDRERERQIEDVQRRVGVVYKTHPHPHRPAPVHLSAREVRAVAELAERRAATTGIPAPQIGAMLLAALPVFKGCAHAGLAAARVHCREWERWAGTPAYKAVREAAGIFQPATGYVAMATLREQGRNPADAHARNWSMGGFVFDGGPAPRRRLGGSYGAAKLAAELAESRATKRAAAKAQAPPARTPTESTIQKISGSYSVAPHIQTAPSPAALPLPAREGDPGSDPDPVSSGLSHAPRESPGPVRIDVPRSSLPVRSPEKFSLILSLLGFLWAGGGSPRLRGSGSGSQALPRGAPVPSSGIHVLRGSCEGFLAVWIPLSKFVVDLLVAAVLLAVGGLPLGAGAAAVVRCFLAALPLPPRFTAPRFDGGGEATPRRLLLAAPRWKACPPSRAGPALGCLPFGHGHGAA
jgi:hypothetical protein